MRTRLSTPTIKKEQTGDKVWIRRRKDNSLHLQRDEPWWSCNPRSRRCIVALVASVVVVGACAVPARVARANQIDVGCPQTDPGQALVQAINAAGTGDTLSLTPKCTYALKVIENDTIGPNGLPVINKTLTIRGHGATISRTSRHKFRILEVSKTGDLTLDDVTVDNGFADQGNAPAPAPAPEKYSRGRGGGIYNLGTLQVVNSTFSHNTASVNGGGIGNGDPQEDDLPNPARGTLKLNKSVVSNNKADHAGGIASGSTSTMDLTDCIVSENRAGGDGGIANQGTATVANCFIIDNVADGDFGGMVNAGDNVKIVNSYIIGNRANGVYPGEFGDGGGVANIGKMEVIGSTIIDNVAEEDAGGVYNPGGTITIIDSYIIHNRAERSGGGISNISGGTAILTTNQIMRNKAAEGGGIFNAPGSTVPSIAGNIVRFNTLDNCKIVPGCIN
jgi:hypothetical protein